MGCTYGKISNVTDFGVYNANSDADIANLCSSTHKLYDTKLPNCAYLSNKSSRLGSLLQSCVGKESCFFKDIDEKALPPGKQKEDSKCVLSKETTLYV